MSISSTLHCNTLRGFSACAQTLITDGLTHEEVRAIGTAHGWRHTDGKDYCPACSGVRGRMRFFLAHGEADGAVRMAEHQAEELLRGAEGMLLALVNGATGGRWAYRPPASLRWAVSAGAAPGTELVAGGPRGTESVARTGPAGHPQAAADAAYIAAVDPQVGRAVTGVLHEAFESVHQDDGRVEDSLTQAAVDLATALTQHRTPQESA